MNKITTSSAAAQLERMYDDLNNMVLRDKRTKIEMECVHADGFYAKPAAGFTVPAGWKLCSSV